jgi:iron complex outermembrane receptor protein
MLRTGFAVLLLLASTRIVAQFTLHGKIVNENGIALPGAGISFKETGYGTVSDKNGGFRFTGLRSGNYTLTASFIGYERYSQRIQLNGDQELVIKLAVSAILGDDIIVTATRAGNNSPIALSNIEKEEIAVRNMGQDIPVLLANTPSFVSTSDAGAGVGYTGFRIRGSDANRINVTVNGVPLNDAESHSVFWVNMPDFSSSLQSIQIQRGVGTSTNGAGAFGASINPMLR